MASAHVLQLDELLQPVSAENPSGNDLRGDASPTSPYFSIKDARNAARAAERKNLFDSDNSEAHDLWRKVAELAPSILRDHAKDLEIASWLTEALVRRHGFQGLRDGFKLIRGLIEGYWDDLYPLPDEDGVETRVASLTGLNGEGAEGVLIAPIRNIGITEGHDPGPFSYWQYQQALEIDKVIDAKAKSERTAKLGFSRDDIERAVSQSSDVFYIDLRDDIAEAKSNYKAIADLLNSRCGISSAPPTSNIINILEDCHGAVSYIGRDKFPLEAEPGNDADAVGDAVADAGDGVVSAGPAGPVRTREEAFKRLVEISDFFRKTEPHSPISYMLRRAVQWGSMPLDDLVRELIPDASAREFFGQLTGVVVTKDD